MIDEQLAKKRFLLFTLARLSGLAIIGLGLAVAFSDLLRDGGWRQVGGLFIAIGTIELVMVPLLLKRAWNAE